MSEFARVLYELRIIGHGLQLQHKQHIKADNNVDEECEWGIENSLCDPQDKSGLNSIKCYKLNFHIQSQCFIVSILEVQGAVCPGRGGAGLGGSLPAAERTSHFSVSKGANLCVNKHAAC